MHRESDSCLNTTKGRGGAGGVWGGVLVDCMHSQLSRRALGNCPWFVNEKNFFKITTTKNTKRGPWYFEEGDERGLKIALVSLRDQ